MHSSLRTGLAVLLVATGALYPAIASADEAPATPNTEAKPDGAKPADAKDADAKDAAKPADAKPADAKDAAKPADAKPADAKDAAKPADAKPADAKDAAKPEPEPEAPADKSKAWETAAHEHRGGFAVGLAIGGGFGASNGFPADAKKIGRADYYTESGIGFAGSGGLWLGGALADWLNFGIGGGFSQILNADTKSPSPILLFHTDVFPLYALGGALRDLGVVADFGLGFPTTRASETDELLIDGSGASFMSAGAFWEGISAWKLKMGPLIAGHYMWSDSIRRPALILGFRGTLYTSP